MREDCTFTLARHVAWKIGLGPEKMRKVKSCMLGDVESTGLAMPVASKTFPEVVAGGLVDLGKKRTEDAAGGVGDHMIVVVTLSIWESTE